MPPIKGSKKNPLTGKMELPKNPSVESPVREQIKTVMGAGGSEDDFVASLPSSTVESTPTGEVIPPAKRGRKPKTEQPDVDPLMADEKYKKAIGNMSGLGGARVVKVGFKATGKPLTNEEESEVDDLFYVIGKRSNLDPGSNWLILGLYAFFLLCRLIVMRTEAGLALAGIFDKPSESEKLEEVVKQ